MEEFPKLIPAFTIRVRQQLSLLTCLALLISPQPRCKRHRSLLWVCVASFSLDPKFPAIPFWADVDSISGQAFSNAGMAVGPIESGTVVSAPGYGPESFEGEIAHGADVFYVDALF